MTTSRPITNAVWGPSVGAGALPCDRWPVFLGSSVRSGGTFVFFVDRPVDKRRYGTSATLREAQKCGCLVRTLVGEKLIGLVVVHYGSATGLRETQQRGLVFGVRIATCVDAPAAAAAESEDCHKQLTMIARPLRGGEVTPLSTPYAAAHVSARAEDGEEKGKGDYGAVAGDADTPC